MKFTELLAAVYAQIPFFQDMNNKFSDSNIASMRAFNVAELQELTAMKEDLIWLRANSKSLMGAKEVLQSYVALGMDDKINAVNKLSPKLTEVLALSDKIEDVSNSKEVLVGIDMEAINKLSANINPIIFVSGKLAEFREVSRDISKAEQVKSELYTAIGISAQERKRASVMATTFNSLDSKIADANKALDRIVNLNISAYFVDNIGESTVEYITGDNMVNIKLVSPKTIKGDKGDNGKGLPYNAIGKIEDRMFYNGADVGFVYAALAPNKSPVFWAKTGSDFADWNKLSFPTIP